MQNRKKNENEKQEDFIRMDKKASEVYNIPYLETMLKRLDVWKRNKK